MGILTTLSEAGRREPRPLPTLITMNDLGRKRCKRTQHRKHRASDPLPTEP